MPLVTDSPAEEQMTLGERGSMPTLAPQAPQDDSALNFAAAVSRRANVAGTLYERLANPLDLQHKPAQPGFDPEVSVPRGAEDHAEIFAGAQSAQEIAWREQQYQREQADNRIIQQHGGWGVAASMAAGLVDPVTLASMAIPIAGETRLATMAGAALAAGGTTALQEGIQQGLEVGRDAKSSALNVAGGAVLGGLLGAVIRPRVPAAEADSIAEGIHAELHDDVPNENALGPIDGRQRIVPEDEIPYEAPHPASEAAPIRPIEEHPDTETANNIAREEADQEGKVLSSQQGGKDAETPRTEAVGIPDVPQSISEPVRAEPVETAKTEIVQSIDEHINPSAESTAGAAQVQTPEARGEQIARGAGFLSKYLGFVSPGARAMHSLSVVVRKLTQELVNLPETLSKNYQGIATASPLERELWKYDGIHYQGMRARSEQYKAYRERVAGEGGAPMARGAFNEEISKAMRRGDVHAVPEIAEAARKTRAIEFEPLKLRAIANGSLPEGVTAKGAESYLMRQYDAVKIRNNLTDFLDRLKRGFVAQGVDIAEAADIAHKAMRNIMGAERGTMDWKVMDGIVPKSGRLKERTLDLPDELLEPYLNSDIDHVAHSYLRSLAPEVEMTDRFGSRDMKDQISAIHDDYARMIERAATDAEKAKLSDRMNADLRDITAMRDRLYGIYGMPKDPAHFAVRAGRLLRTVNALRLLGAATLAHFPDVANVMMRYGLPNTFAAIGKVLTSPEALQLTRAEAKRMGAGLDMSMNATASMLGDYANHSQWAPQRIAQGIAQRFTIITGETPLITMVQQLTSTMAQDAIVRAAQKVAAGKSLESNLAAKLAGAGLDEDMLRRIADQHQQFGAKVNGLNFGMSDQWKDGAAASAFESAILRDAHSVTLRPGAGDTPLFMSTEWGKALRQFTTFGYAAQRSVVNPLMQGIAHGDPKAAQALFALVAAGTLSYVAKQTAAQQPIEDAGSARFALEVLDKSNLMGWTSDYVFPALWMLGHKSLSRWSDRDPVETIGGPVVGTVFNTYQKQLPGKALAAAGLADDDQKTISRADLHFMRRMMPGQNLWYARGAINELEDAVGDAFDLPGKSNKDRAADTQAAGQ